MMAYEYFILTLQFKKLQGKAFVNKLRLTFVPFTLAEFVIYCNRQQFSFLERGGATMEAILSL